MRFLRGKGPLPRCKPRLGSRGQRARECFAALLLDQRFFALADFTDIRGWRAFTLHRARATPVKECAVKVNVELPPTPSGVREAIRAGSPSTRQHAKRQLQRHQKACQQKVARAEERNPELMEKRNADGSRTCLYSCYSMRFGRHRAVHNATAARSSRKRRSGKSAGP